MNVRKALAALLAASLVPVLASAQTYDANQNIKNVLPSLPFAPFTLSTACGTPTTPNSCASTSFKIIPTSGAEELSLQVDTISGGTIAFYASNTNGTFYPINLSIGPSAVAGQLTVASSTTTAGRYSLNTSGTAYLAVVMTVASTSAVTVTPYLSQHGSAISIHSSVNIPVLPAPSATFGVNANILGTVPVVLPTNAADSGAVVHIANTPSPSATNADGGLLVHQQNNPTPIPTPAGGIYPISGAPTPIPTPAGGTYPVSGTVTATVSNLGSPAPVLPVTVNPTATYGPLNVDALGNLLTSNSAGAGTANTTPAYTRIVSGSASATATVFTPADSVSNAASLLTESFGMGYNTTTNQWDRLREAAGLSTGYTANVLATALCDPILAICSRLDSLGNQNINVAAITPQGGSGSSTSASVGDVIPSSGYGSITFTTTGTYSASTYALQASSDGGNTYPWTLPMGNSSGAYVTSATTNNSFKANIAGYDHVRVIFTAYGSGTLNVAWNLAVPPPAPLVAAYSAASAVCTNSATLTCATVQTPNTAQSFQSSLYVAAAPIIYNGATTDPARSTSAYAAPSTVVGVAAVGSVCNLSAPISSITAVTQLVALSSGKVPIVCGYTLTATTTSGAATLQFESGTGTTCGTGTATITGPMSITASTPLVANSVGQLFNAPVSTALCLLPGGTGTSVSGYITYGLQ